MGTAAVTKTMEASSPRSKASLAGILYMAAVLAAALAEALVRGRLVVLAGLVAVGGYVAMTYFLYEIFKPVNASLASLAATLNFVSGGFEVLQWNPWGVHMAIALHGTSCLLIAYLGSRSNFLPRILSQAMVAAALCWLTALWPPFADALAPYNTAVGILCEGSLMVWLLLTNLAGTERENAARQ